MDAKSGDDDVYVYSVVKHLLGQPWTAFLVKILMSRLDSRNVVSTLCLTTTVSTHQLTFCDMVRLHHFQVMLLHGFGWVIDSVNAHSVCL